MAWLCYTFLSFSPCCWITFRGFRWKITLTHTSGSAFGITFHGHGLKKDPHKWKGYFQGSWHTWPMDGLSKSVYLRVSRSMVDLGCLPPQGFRYASSECSHSFCDGLDIASSRLLASLHSCLAPLPTLASRSTGEPFWLFGIPLHQPTYSWGFGALLHPWAQPLSCSETTFPWHVNIYTRTSLGQGFKLCAGKGKLSTSLCLCLLPSHSSPQGSGIPGSSGHAWHLCAIWSPSCPWHSKDLGFHLMNISCTCPNPGPLCLLVPEILMVGLPISLQLPTFPYGGIISKIQIWLCHIPTLGILWAP